MQKYIIIAIVSVLAITLIAYGYKYPSVTTDSKIEQVKELREQKKVLEKEIADREDQIYKINQKIIPLKCSAYNDVGAKEQWDIECSELYNQQQNGQ